MPVEIYARVVGVVLHKEFAADGGSCRYGHNALALLMAFCLTATVFCREGAANPPVNRVWQETYVKGNKNREFRIRGYEANCRVCHQINAKGLMQGFNGYGDAVKQFIKKSELTELNTDHDKRQAYIEDGLRRAGREPSANGKTFQEIFDAGERPWMLPD